MLIFCFVYLVVGYECIRIIISIYFDKSLIDKVVKCVGLFFVVKINDIKYFGKLFYLMKYFLILIEGFIFSVV